MCSHSTEKYLISSVEKLDVCLYATVTNKHSKRNLQNGEDAYERKCDIQ